MKKLFSLFFTLIGFIVPTLIVKYYSANIDPMSPSEEKMAITAGTLAMIILAIFTGFGGQKPSVPTTGKIPKGKIPKVLKTPKVSVPKTRIVKDPGAHGAETLYTWNEKDQVWESDNGTILDDRNLDEWERQRRSDREWADKQMDKLKNRDTAFDREMDELKKRQEKELREMEKEMEDARKFGEKHGKYDLTREERMKWLQDEQAKEDLLSKEWQEYGNEYDKIVNRLEWIQYIADIGVDVCDIVSLGTLRPVKNIYLASRNTAGDLMDALVNKKSLGKTLLKTVTKSTIDITQANVSKIKYKYAANGLGDGIKEAIEASEEGKSATGGFFRGWAKGTVRSGIDHGLSKVKLPDTDKAKNIMKQTTEKSQKYLGMQQSGQITEKVSNALRNNVRSEGALKLAAERGKSKDLLSEGLGKMTDGLINLTK